MESSNLVNMKNFASLLTFGHNFTNFYAYNCTELVDVPKVTKSFLASEFYNVTTNNESASRILRRFQKVNETPKLLTFDLVPLTLFVPRELNLFPNLQFITITRTTISFIQEGAFNLDSSLFSSGQLRQISLKGNKIKTISPEAFMGKKDD